jgi:sugar lactone lactonase YvrE
MLMGSQKLAIILITALLIVTSAISTITPESVSAYTEDQAASQASECGNEFMPINVGCQNTDSDIQADENAAALTAQQTFPEVKPIPPPPKTAALNVFKEVICPQFFICPAPGGFTINVVGNNPNPSSFRASPMGTVVSLEPGHYEVTEPGRHNTPTGLNALDPVFSPDCNGDIQAGQELTCTITNEYVVQITEYVFSEEFAPEEDFSNPDVTIDKQTGNIFVADYFHNRVVELDPSGNVITQWGTTGSGEGQFINPQDVGIDSDGFIYVVDTRNHRIQKFTNDVPPQFVDEWGSFGTTDGQFRFPDRIAIDSNDFIYVTDDGNGRVQKFTTTGQFVSKFGENYLSVPVGIGTDSNNNVYVAESEGERVSKFSSTGQLITAWGTSGSGPGQFGHPKGLTLDEGNNVYVADEFNNRIQKFDSNGNFITEFGQDRLGRPIDVAVDSQGIVYASDEAFSQILIYAPVVP